MLARYGLALATMWAAAGQLTAQEATDVWQRIDDLSDAKDFDDVFALLEPLANDHGSDVEYLWRMARHHFNVSDNTTDEAVIETALYTGFKFAQSALAADSNSADAHGYYGILIGRVGEIEGMKQKIINSFAVRDHTLRAIALDPDYATWHHVMGRWHYTLADLSWIERTVASIVYESPPEATFGEAEKYFQRATILEPDEIRHFLWLGKTQLELDQAAAARTNFKHALILPIKSDSDTILQQEARELLD
ncbi:MAG: hypothetical protein V3W14_04525 [Candidatus Neomarinimicrobiota bacterium]